MTLDDIIRQISVFSEVSDDPNYVKISKARLTNWKVELEGIQEHIQKLRQMGKDTLNNDPATKLAVFAANFQ